MATNPAEIAAWGAVVATITGLATKGIDTWLARRNKQLEEDTKARGLTVEERRTAIEMQKAADDADAKLIAALMEERKVYQAEIRELRAEVSAERTRCDAEMEKMSLRFDARIVAEKAQMQENFNRQIEEMRENLRQVVAEAAELRAANAQMRQELERLK